MAKTVVTGGWLQGHAIRRARKAHRCNYWHGNLSGYDQSRPRGRCKTIIQPGETYVEGEANDEAGGFGNDRYCLSCAGIEAQADAAKAEGSPVPA